MSYDYGLGLYALKSIKICVYDFIWKKHALEDKKKKYAMWIHEPKTRNYEITTIDYVRLMRVELILQHVQNNTKYAYLYIILKYREICSFRC